MHRPAFVRLALCVGTLLFVLGGVAACGGGGAPEEAKPSPLPEEPRKLGPGTYRTEDFEPPFSFRVGEGWSTSLPEEYDDLRITRGHETGGLGFANLRGARFFEPTKTGTPYMADVPKDVAGWFQEHPYLRTSEPEPTRVGGVEGLRFDVIVGDLPEGHSGECGSDCVDLFRFSSGGQRPFALWEGSKLRLFVLEDVEGEKIIMGFGGPVAEFDEHAPEARKVIDTVQWRGS